MPSFSETSNRRLSTCHPILQDIFGEVVKHFDCSILEGHRVKEKQDLYKRTGQSKVAWPNSRHNDIPSLAVDAAPYPIDWEDRERFSYFAGFVKGVAAAKGYAIRWGGDWNSDTEVKDNSFDDLPHFELVNK